MTTRTSFLALAFLLIPALTAFAGMDYPMKCKNCGFTCRVQIGGGMGFEQITGFCVETGKFVYLQWKRGEKKPEPMAKVWDSATGKMIEIYKCPDCPQPFIPLQRKANDAEAQGSTTAPSAANRPSRWTRTRALSLSIEVRSCMLVLLIVAGVLLLAGFVVGLVFFSCSWSSHLAEPRVAGKNWPKCTARNNPPTGQITKGKRSRSGP